MNNPFSRLPLVQNIQAAVDTALHSVVNAAEEVASNFPFHPAQQAGANAFPNHFQFRRDVRQPEQQAAENHHGPAPPASARAIRQIPTILVAPEDLVEPCNRECCICLDEIHLKERVTRMPCAHIFHSACLIDWLNHHCTCPTCRYELETDDPQYEAGRMQRMQTRKPRFAMYELQRMSIPQLLALNRRPVPPGGMEKTELIQMLIDEERIHLIPTPEPVEFELKTLQAMGISDLKRTMEQAGVFFHPKDVVEKSDMLTIFYNSGRLNVIPSTAADEEEVENQNYPVVNQQNYNQSSPRSTDYTINQATQESTASLQSHKPRVETVTEESDDEQETSMVDQVDAIPPSQEMFPSNSTDVLTSRACISETRHVPSERMPSKVADVTNPEQPSPESNFDSLNLEAESPPSLSCEDHDASAILASEYLKAVHIQGDEFERSSDITVTNHNHSPLLPDDLKNLSEAVSARYEDEDADDSSNLSRKRPRATQFRLSDNHLSDNNLGESCRDRNPFQDCTISRLQTIARENNVDLSMCFERSEMEQILKTAGITDPSQNQLSTVTFSNWSVSQLRALASEADIDLSRCSDREEMLRRILHEANHERPHLRSYLLSLAPLATSSLSELRGIAREWRVNISDCLEKEEIINRLLTRGKSFGTC